METHEALALRSLDEPLTPDERDALRVWGDALEWAGDPRGALIALEHALRDQPGRGRELQRAMTEHVLANADALLGDFAPVVEFPRAAMLDWRSGLLRGAFVDTRYVAARNGLTPERLVARLLGAPCSFTLRRLHVRVRTTADGEPVMAMLRTTAKAGALEEIVVLPGVRPSVIGWRRVRSSPHARALAGEVCDLRLLVEDAGMVALPLAVSASQPAGALRGLFATVDPGARDGRVMLGRAVINPDREVHAAALERLRELGPRAFMFLETLMMLLQPDMANPQAPVVTCLAALGEHARLALPLLATITGRAAHYDADTRRAAGVAIAALRR